MNRDFFTTFSGRIISAQQFLRFRQAYEFVQDYAFHEGRHLGRLSDADTYVSEAFGAFTFRQVESFIEDFEVQNLERISLYSSVEEYDRYEGDDS